MNSGLDALDFASTDETDGQCEGSLNDRTASVRVEHPWHRDSGAYAEAGEIGNGAYARVSLARHKLTGENVALKKITLPIREEGVPQSVIREVSLLKRFERDNHPNIVKLLDVCHGLSENGRQLYMNLVFEYCPQDLGMFLETSARNGIPLADSTIRRMIGEIAFGVKFLHSQAVVHRDLKPQNVLISVEGRLKIADYGLARMYSLQAALTTVVVTLWYRSPELLLQCDYGFAVDVWSVGCIMAEMYRLRALFPGDTEVNQLVRILQVIGLPPAHLWPQSARVSRSSFESLPMCSSLRQKVHTAPTSAMDLIQKMLTFCADERPTIAEVLEHRYFFDTTSPSLAYCSSSSSSSSCSDSGF